MSDQNGSQRRRLSIVDIFGGQKPTSPSGSTSPPSAGVPASPDVPQHRRGVSIGQLGLGGNGQNQSSPYNAFARQRRASISTSTASNSPEFRNSFSDDHAVIEEDDSVRADQGSPTTGFARRVSFGAQALRDVRGGSGVGSANVGEGFNWSEALRDKTRRSPSFSTGNPFASRTKSMATANIPEPPKEVPKTTMSPPPKLKKPDHIGERMLRGDFMMD